MRLSTFILCAALFAWSIFVGRDFAPAWFGLEGLAEWRSIVIAALFAAVGLVFLLHLSRWWGMEKNILEKSANVALMLMLAAAAVGLCFSGVLLLGSSAAQQAHRAEYAQRVDQYFVDMQAFMDEDALLLADIRRGADELRHLSDSSDNPSLKKEAELYLFAIKIDGIANDLDRRQRIKFAALRWQRQSFWNGQSLEPVLALNELEYDIAGEAYERLVILNVDVPAEARPLLAQFRAQARDQALKWPPFLPQWENVTNEQLVFLHAFSIWWAWLVSMTLSFAMPYLILWAGHKQALGEADPQ